MSFSTALTALNADSTAINTVGNNLANLNTTGFKDSVVSFKDLVAQSFSDPAKQVGAGVGNVFTSKQFTQGGIQVTHGTLDAAIQGNGFFVVNDSNGNQLFTRDGSFQVDSSGNLLTSTGEHVQGWTEVNGVLNTNGPTGNILIPSGAQSQPVATTKLSVGLNLSADAVKGNATTGTFTAPVQVYDSLGKSHILNITFTNTAAGAWDYEVTIPGEDTASGKLGTPVSLGKGSVTFNSDGTLKTPAAGSPVQIAVSGLADGAANMNINWDFYGSDQKGLLTGYAQSSAVSSTDQDGSAAAQLLGVGISDGGRIMGQYSNGKQLVIGQLAVAGIGNPDSLVDVGNNNYATSADTSAPVIGTGGSGGRGQVLGGSVESSNVDMATEFTNLLVFQRSYQANSRVITTMDQITQETLNLKQ